jgi:hypothetical protein
MTDAEMKVGTKAFGIPLFGCFARCRTRKVRELSDGRFFARERPSARIIVQRAGQVPIAKLGLVLEETDETVFWLQMLADCNIVAGTRLKSLIREANELTASSWRL